MYVVFVCRRLLRAFDGRAHVGSRDIFSTSWYRKRLKPFMAQIKALKRSNDDLKKQQKNFEIKLDRVSQGKTVDENQEQEHGVRYLAPCM